MRRYAMSVWSIIGYIIVLFFNCVCLEGFSGFYMFMDGPALFFMLAFLLLTLWGTGAIKDFTNGIKIGLGFKKTYSMLELKKAEQTLHLIMRSQLFCGCIIATMSIISMLYHMEMPSTIGPALALGLVSILYALIISLILTPFKSRIHMLLIAYAEENATKEDILNEELLEQRAFYLFRSKGLTDREAEIARLISQELTNREIAGKLYISEATVKKHITHILEKLGLEGRDAIIELIQQETIPNSTYTISSKNAE